MASHLTLSGPVHVEPDPIKKSRFIGDGAPVTSAEAAMAFIDVVRQRYGDARHHCFAWRLQSGDRGFRTSDDGEPGGTGGQPILNHIDGAQLLGVVFVVTRYFGGTKLGKGGLIRAYGGTTGEAIRAAQIIEVQEKRALTINASYGDMGVIEGVLRGFDLEMTSAEYSDNVRITVDVPIEEVPALRNLLVESTSGRIAISEPTPTDD